MKTWVPWLLQSYFKWSVATCVCWLPTGRCRYRTCPSLQQVLIDEAAWSFWKLRVVKPCWKHSLCCFPRGLVILLDFLLLWHHIAQQFLSSDNFADKFCSSYWALAPETFLTHFYGKWFALTALMWRAI